METRGPILNPAATHASDIVARPTRAGLARPQQRHKTGVCQVTPSGSVLGLTHMIQSCGCQHSAISQGSLQGGAGKHSANRHIYTRSARETTLAYHIWSSCDLT